MKKTSGILCAVLVTTSTFGAIHTGQMVVNPFFTDNKDNWNTSGQWRPNGAANLVHDFTTAAGSGYSTATGATLDLTTEAAITADADYNPSTTLLTDLSLGNVWVLIPNWNTGNIATNLDARFYVEIDISTLSGNEYRMSSDRLTVDQNMQMGGYAQSFTLQNYATYGTYDGNPFEGGAGIALGDIDTINYKWVMQTITPNTEGAGTVFFQADNATLNYEVTTIPEPGTLGLVACFGGGILCLRRLSM